MARLFSLHCLEVDLLFGLCFFLGVESFSDVLVFLGVFAALIVVVKDHAMCGGPADGFCVKQILERLVCCGDRNATQGPMLWVVDGEKECGVLFVQSMFYDFRCVFCDGGMDVYDPSSKIITCFCEADVCVVCVEVRFLFGDGE